MPPTDAHDRTRNMAASGLRSESYTAYVIEQAFHICYDITRLGIVLQSEATGTIVERGSDREQRGIGICYLYDTCMCEKMGAVPVNGLSANVGRKLYKQLSGASL